MRNLFNMQANRIILSLSKKTNSLPSFVKYLIFCLFTFTILALTCFTTSYNRLLPRQFDSFSNWYILSNLVHDKQHPENDSGFIEFYSRGDRNQVTSDFIHSAKVDEKEFRLYFSPIAANAQFYSWFYNNSTLPPLQTLSFLFNLNLFLMALILTFFVLLVKFEADTLTALLFLMFLAFLSPGLLVFSSNLYWSAWSLLFPFVLVSWVSRMVIQKGKTKYWPMLILSAFLGVLPRFLFSFEYISTLLISLTVPVFFYCLCRKLSFRILLANVVLVGTGGLLAFATSLFIFYKKLTHVFPSTEVSFAAFKSVLFKHTNTALFSSILEANGLNPYEKLNLAKFGYELSKKALSLNVHPAPEISDNKFLTIISYFDAPVFSIGTVNITFYHFLFFALMMSFIVYYLSANKIIASSEALTLRPLAVSTAISLLAPLSWHILATHHSVIHLHLNFVLFYLPYMLLLGLYIILSTRLVISNFPAILQYEKNAKKIRSQLKSQKSRP